MATTRFNVKEHILDAGYIREYPRSLANTKDDDLKLHIRQYIPKSPPKTSRVVTIIGAHANGFPKELYEPLWDELASRCSAHGFEIASVWTADVAWQGQSSVINEEKLGNDPSWFDHSRDLLHMINTFRSEMPQPLVGFGHSMGGCQITNLALFHARLFAALVLLDPVISLGNVMAPKDQAANRFGIAWQSSYRKDIWNSREEAAESFRRSPFYQLWDPRVLDLWIKHGLRDLPTAIHPNIKEVDSHPVTLTTPKSLEVRSFLRPNYDGQGLDGQRPIDRTTHADVDPESAYIFPFYRPEIRNVYMRLPNLRPPTYYIFGGISLLGTKESQYEKVLKTGTGVGGSGGKEEGRVEGTFIENVGHLVPMEAPVKTADVALDWLGKTLEEWFEQAETFAKHWNSVDLRDKQTLDKQFLDTMGPPPSRVPPKNKL